MTPMLPSLSTPHTFHFASPQLGFFKSAKRKREPGLGPIPKELK